MALVEHLTSADVLLAPQVNSKWELIDLMVERLVSSGSLDASMEGAAKSALVEREKSVSTGMEHGIAVPHAALDDLHCLKVAMGLIPDGLEFQTVDGKPAEIVILAASAVLAALAAVWLGTVFEDQMVDLWMRSS